MVSQVEHNKILEQLKYDDFIFTGRGSTALWAILKGINQPGSSIIVPVNICEIIIPIILKAGMIPVFCDVDPKTGLMTIDTIKKIYTGKERLILAVHNFGVPLDIKSICKWAVKEKVFVIEDVCNSLGASYNNRALGLWGDAAIFSFGYVKIIENGVGGAAIIKDKVLRTSVCELVQSLEVYSTKHNSKNEEYQSKLREIRNHPELQNPLTYLPLYNDYANYLLYKIDQNTINSIKDRLLGLNEEIEMRNNKSLKYRSGIKTSSIIKHIPDHNGQIYWRYNILVEPKMRDVLVRYLRENKVLVSYWYPPVISLFMEEYDKLSFSGSFAFSESIINLFVDNRVNMIEIERTIELINGQRWLSQ